MSLESFRLAKDCRRSAFGRVAAVASFAGAFLMSSIAFAQNHCANDPPNINCGTGVACCDLQGHNRGCSSSGQCGCPFLPNEGCPAGQSCVSGQCRCPGGTTLCGSACVDITEDLKNCGGCGQTCTGGKCSGGRCSCPGELKLCSGACVDTDTNNLNCGGCGNVCIRSGGHTCWEGNCTCPPSTPDSCEDEKVPIGVCVNLKRDSSHCGECAYRCTSGKCVDGRCVQTSAVGGNLGGGSSGGGKSGGSSSGGAQGGGLGGIHSGTVICTSQTPNICDGKCVALDRDPNNCGQCGRGCNPTYQCFAGRCMQLKIHKVPMK
jgi:hypothetical protein